MLLSGSPANSLLSLLHLQYNTIALEVSARVTPCWQHGATLTCSWIYFTPQQDPNGIRIAQWLNQTTARKILQLSHKLSSEAAEGSYRIRVEADGEQALRWFKVEEYGGSWSRRVRFPPRRER